MSDKNKFERFKQLLSGGATSDECLFYDCNDNIIIIGADRLQTFKMPLKFKSIKKLVLIYTQDNKIILKKTLKDFKLSDFDDTLIYFNLSENETFKFKEGKVEAQMKVLLEDNSILVSSILKINAIKTIDDLKFNIYTSNIESIQATVKDQEINVIQLAEIAAGSNKTHYCKFIFDSSWDKLTKKAIFKDEYNNYIDNITITEDDLCAIPKNIIGQPGNIYVGVLGTSSNVERPTEWSNSIRVLNSCTYKEFLYEQQESDSSSSDTLETDEDVTITQRSITDGSNSIQFNVDDFSNYLISDVDFEQEI